MGTTDRQDQQRNRRDGGSIFVVATNIVFGHSQDPQPVLLVWTLATRFVLLVHELWFAFAPYGTPTIMPLLYPMRLSFYDLRSDTLAELDALQVRMVRKGIRGQTL